MQIRSLFSGRHVAGGAAAAALSLAIAPDARAGKCVDESHPVYVTGSSALKPFLAKVAGKLKALPTPITVVYQSQGSCAGVASMEAAGGTISGTTPVTWDSTGKATATGCDLDLAGNAVDIGASDVYANTCGKTVFTDVKDFHGPIQIMTFSVPKDSGATAITAEAAYLVYGFGAASNVVAPWSDSTVIFQRNGGSGTQNMIATAINVPAAKWQPAANANASSDLIYAALTKAQTDGKAAAAIGILSTDYADLHRDTVKVLAYQHYDQACGYLPDSSGTSFDKVNVRDGHYMIWGPLHLYTHTAAGGQSANPDVQTVLDLLSLVSDDGTMIQTEAKAGVVPDCAMHVSRTAEIGPLASYEPAHGCECKYLFEATGKVPADCKTCTDATKAADCKVAGSRGTACNFGYCEAR
jgi:ABC-type phosphate transport system substrate-binding protein